MYYGKYLLDNKRTDQASKYFLMADSIYYTDIFDTPSVFKHSDIQRHIADVHILNKKYHEAIIILESLEINYKDKMNINDFQNLIQCYIFTNQMELVKGKSLECLEKNPLNAKLYSYLGLYYNYKNDFESAIRQFTKAIEIKPNFYDALLNKGIVYHALGKLDSSLVMMKKCIILSPDNQEAYNISKNIISSIRTNKKENFNPDLLIDELSGFISIFEKIGMKEAVSLIYQKLGLLYSNAGKSKEAINCFKNALKLNLKNTEAHVNLGLEYLSDNQNEEGLKLLLNAIEFKRGDPLLNFSISLAYYRLKRYNAALKYTQLSKKLGMDNRADTLIKNIETSMRNNKN